MIQNPKQKNQKEKKIKLLDLAGHRKCKIKDDPKGLTAF